jgi:hypothetical protein
MKEIEFSKSTTQTRMMKLETEYSPVITAEAPDPTVTTEAAPPTKVTSEASKEPSILTPTAAEENPAEEISEEAKEEAADEPMETFTKPVVDDTPTTETPTPPVATEASPALDPGGDNTALEDIETTLVVISEQNRKTTKKAPIKVRDNQAAQVPETFSKVGALLTDDDDAFTGRASPINPDPIGPMSDDTKEPNMPGAATGAVNKPKTVEHCANAAQASMTSHQASKMAGPGTDPPEVAREGTKEEDVTKSECNPESDNPCSSSRRESWSPRTSCT